MLILLKIWDKVFKIRKLKLIQLMPIMQMICLNLHLVEVADLELTMLMTYLIRSTLILTPKCKAQQIIPLWKELHFPLCQWVGLIIRTNIIVAWLIILAVWVTVECSNTILIRWIIAKVALWLVREKLWQMLILREINNLFSNLMLCPRIIFIDQWGQLPPKIWSLALKSTVELQIILNTMLWTTTRQLKNR